MIEINLLPPQYRTVEQTSWAVVGGLVTMGALLVVSLIFLLALAKTQSRLDEQKGALVAERDKKAKDVEDIKKIELELQASRGRIDTVIAIAEGKIHWSRKLDQLAQTLPKDVWIESLGMDGSKLALTCKARGSGYQRYTNLRQEFRDATNFIYHFGDVRATAIDISDTAPQFTERQVLSFNLPLILRPAEEIGAPAPRQ